MVLVPLMLSGTWLLVGTHAIQGLLESSKTFLLDSHIVLKIYRKSEEWSYALKIYLSQFVQYE